MLKREVVKAMKSAGIVGEVTGKGREWEVEVADEETYDRLKSEAQKLGGTFGGYKTGYGAWVAQGSPRAYNGND